MDSSLSFSDDVLWPTRDIIRYSMLCCYSMHAMFCNNWTCALFSSSGVLIWEVFNEGRPPYENLSNLEVVESLNSGLRLLKPRLAPDSVYMLMEWCWKEVEMEFFFCMKTNQLHTKKSCENNQFNLCCFSETRGPSIVCHPPPWTVVPLRLTCHLRTYEELYLFYLFNHLWIGLSNVWEVKVITRQKTNVFYIALYTSVSKCSEGSRCPFTQILSHFHIDILSILVVVLPKWLCWQILNVTFLFSLLSVLFFFSSTVVCRSRKC